MSLNLIFVSEFEESKYKKYILPDKLNNILGVIENIPNLNLKDCIGLSYSNLITKLLNYVSLMRPLITSYKYPSTFVRFWTDIRKQEEITLKSDIQLILYFIIKLEFINIPEDYIIKNSIYT
jgi:hypothetical protein